MSVRVSVIQGTPSSTEDLCKSCVNVQRVVSVEGHEFRQCMLSFSRPLILTRKVSTCSDYRNKHLPSIQELKEIAWDIVSKGERGSRKVGFVSPQERRELRIKRDGDGDVPPPIPGDDDF